MTKPAHPNTYSAVVLILQLLGYISAFAAPATVLSLSFPEYTIWIVLTAIASMLAVAGFIVGLNWNTTEWTDENRLSTQKVMFDILHLPLPCDLPEAHSRLQKLARYMVLPTIIAGVCLAGLLLWNKPITGTALEIIGPAIIVSVLILPSFLLDRTVKNWEERKSGQRIVTRTNNHQETDDNNSPNY